MPDARLTKLRQLLSLLAGVLVLKVTLAVSLGYVNYLPPNFRADFLHGREDYFYGGYQGAFYTHIAAGPVALVVGTLLVSERLQRRFPASHRVLGRVQVANVLLLVAPSGLWMSYYAAAGAVAAVAFASLAVATGACAALGFRSAVQRRFAAHRRWMWRCYLLLCSAVVLRLVVGLATVCQFAPGWFDPLVSWACWLAPLVGYELLSHWRRRTGQLSPPAIEMSALHLAAGNSA
ncbi:MAG TPA: DUF2306 domain-containing protein [Pirellulales bacterium]|nr:DUF2306 domain-containing protein [Pirellulales bacterium]